MQNLTVLVKQLQGDPGNEAVNLTLVRIIIELLAGSADCEKNINQQFFSVTRWRLRRIVFGHNTPRLNSGSRKDVIEMFGAFGLLSRIISEIVAVQQRRDQDQ